VEVGELLRAGAESTSPKVEQGFEPRRFAAVYQEREVIAGCSLSSTLGGALAQEASDLNPRFCKTQLKHVIPHLLNWEISQPLWQSLPTSMAIPPLFSGLQF